MAKNRSRRRRSATRSSPSAPCARWRARYSCAGLRRGACRCRFFGRETAGTPLPGSFASVAAPAGPSPGSTTAAASSRRTSRPVSLVDFDSRRSRRACPRRYARHAGHRRQRRFRVGAHRVHLHVASFPTRADAPSGCPACRPPRPSLVDDDDALAGLTDLGKDVRAQDDRVVAAELLDQPARLDDLLRVEAGGRLVEDQHLGVVEQRLREADPLPVALRELAAMAVAPRRRSASAPSPC